MASPNLDHLASVHRIPIPARALEMGPPARVRRLRDWVRLWAGRALRGLPGFVREIELEDEATGQHLSVRVSPFFTRISMNGRDFYFDRFTGRFDGTGTGA